MVDTLSRILTIEKPTGADSSQQAGVQPTLPEVRQLLQEAIKLPNPPNLVPLCASISSEFLTPSSIYLKVSAKSVQINRRNHNDYSSSPSTVPSRNTLSSSRALPRQRQSAATVLSVLIRDTSSRLEKAMAPKQTPYPSSTRNFQNAASQTSLPSSCLP